MRWTWSAPGKPGAEILFGGNYLCGGVTEGMRQRLHQIPWSVLTTRVFEEVTLDDD